MADQVIERSTASIDNMTARFLIEEVADLTVMDLYVDPRNPGQVVMSYQGREQHCAVTDVTVMFSKERVEPGWTALRENGTCIGYAHIRDRRLN